MTVPSNLVRLNTNTMVIEDAYQFPSGYFGNSPQFVPRSENSDNTKDGYITAIVYANSSSSIEPGHEEIWIFNASKLSDGPICKLSHPKLKFGFTIHSAWMPTIQPQHSNYRIPIEEDYADLLNQEPPIIRQLFEQYVFPNFE